MLITVDDRLQEGEILKHHYDWKRRRIFSKKTLLDNLI